MVCKTKSTDPEEGSSPWDKLNLHCRRDLLESIFLASSLSELKTFRLVCTLWNEEVLRVLPTKVPTISSSSGALSALAKTLDAQDELSRSLYFTSLKASICSIIPGKSFQHIVTNHGVSLKRLELEGGRGLVGSPWLASVLGEWCPALESLRIFCSSATPSSAAAEEGGRESCLNSPFRTFRTRTDPRHVGGKETRLKTIELDGSSISRDCSSSILLLTSSPLLQRLRVSFGRVVKGGTTVWGEEEEGGSGVRSFLLGLRAHPQVTERLKEFTLIGIKVPGLSSLLSELRFSPKVLKVLGISGASNISDPEFPQFTNFLEQFSSPGSESKLEKLTIYKCGCAHCEWRHWRGLSRAWEIEQTMPVLGSIKCLEFASNGAYRVASLSLLAKFPHLEKLEFTDCNVGHEDPNRHRDNAGGAPVEFDYFFRDWAFLKRIHFGRRIIQSCGNLRELRIHHALGRLESFKFIAECCPSLKTLSISINSDVLYVWEVFMEEKMSLPSVLETLRTLGKLEELYIMVGTDKNKKMLYPRQEVCRGVKISINFPELRHFTITYGAIGSRNRGSFSNGNSSYRIKDASDKSIRNLFSDIILDPNSYKYRTLHITIYGICCCGHLKEELAELRKGLNGYKHSYRLNWCCNRSARILARIGNKIYETIPLQT